MRRVVIDTNLYIDWLNAGRHETILFARDVVKYLSAVVLMELYSGAFSVQDRRLIRTVSSVFVKAGRVLVPAQGLYEDAGHVLRLLQQSRHYTVAGKHSLVNDVLIALSARTIGASVITRNERDFRAIQDIRHFDLIPVRA